MSKSNHTQTSNGIHAKTSTTTPPPQSKQPTTTSTSPSSSLSPKALLFMALLALQFGIQPIVTKKFTSGKVIKSTVIFMQEVVKLVIAFGGITLSGVSWGEVLKGWTITSWLRLSLLPATIYLIQNMCSLLAYQNLDAITYNVLNQTKTLSAALCCYLLLRKKQSSMQMLALILLLVAALVMEGVLPLDYEYYLGFFLEMESTTKTTMATTLGDGETEDATTVTTKLISSSSPSSYFALTSRHVSHGVLPIAIASLLSGLAGAITQKSLQNQNRHALLFTMELCIASLLLLLLSFAFQSQDGMRIRQQGFFDEWTVFTLIPILTNSAGGILVGLVIKYAGTVRKGFALIFGILISGFLQGVLMGGGGVEEKAVHGVSGFGGLSLEEVVGGVLAGVSLWMHSAHPYVGKKDMVRKDEKKVDALICRDGTKSKDASNGKTAGRRSKKED
mmetsp:Transcript_7113/g.15475  ORF Transcript_7113/g.15475 Transcript_7113/m.15475 type:complete len:447 (-) Transcript_7113:1322-2662(-)